MWSCIGSSSRWTTSCWHTAKLQMSCNRSWRRYNFSANPCSTHSLTLPVLSNMMPDQLRPYSHNNMSQVSTEVITNALYKCDFDPRPTCHSTSATCCDINIVHRSGIVYQATSYAYVLLPFPIIFFSSYGCAHKVDSTLCWRESTAHIVSITR